MLCIGDIVQVADHRVRGEDLPAWVRAMDRYFGREAEVIDVIEYDGVYATLYHIEVDGEDTGFNWGEGQIELCSLEIFDPALKEELIKLFR